MWREWVRAVVQEPTARDSTPNRRAGSRFGHYRLRRLLGRGGFGEVYEAHDTVMDRVVALKLMAAPFSHNEVFRQRLFREARTAGRLHEPHVVPIHQCGEIDGQLFIDMRLIEGTDLQSLLAREGPLDPARAVAIVAQIAAALDAAHGERVIHRDVKPANILLTSDDFACLVDFGLANAATDAKLTSSGTTIGTFAYMAPERLGNAEVDHRADIYALACVLYECLTGSPPYAIGDLPALITAHLSAPIPRPSHQQPNIPARFDDVIARGMAKNPNDRYPSAGKLASAARDALTTPARDRMDAVLASTQAAPLPAAAEAATLPAPPRQPATAPPGTAGTSATPPAAPRPRRRAVITLSALALIAVVIAVAITAIVGHRSSRPAQVALPFTGLNDPSGVAVDTSGNVYVTDRSGNNPLLKLSAGSNIPLALPFTGQGELAGVAVDTGGNVYVTIENYKRVLKLPAGSTTPVELPFTGLMGPLGVAVDTAGNVYVADYVSNRLLKLPAGSNTPVELPFTGLVAGVAVDTAGTVYVTNGVDSRVLKLPAGSNTPVELPFTGLNNPDGVAVDTVGNVYVADYGNNRVLKLPAGSTTQVELPLSGLHNPTGVAVDTAGNVYVADKGNHRVLKLPTR